ncbi:thioredoxin family protein [Balneolales bacterium ANBcel1]|nr:thioredoxin family protein [Balneolales bacterium ANBcel1]
MAKVITREHIEQAMSYARFRDLVNSLLIERKTTGPNQSGELVQYTRLNNQRMDRMDKTTIIDPELLEALKAIRENQIWLGIVEAWCGDVPHAIPALAKMAVSAPKVSMRLLLRDEHPEVIDAYLTNGGRAIPKVIALNRDTLEELWTWGPRPEPAQKLFLDLKEKGEPYPAIAEELQKWNNKDKTRTLQKEILERVRSV